MQIVVINIFENQADGALGIFSDAESVGFRPSAIRCVRLPDDQGWAFRVVTDLVRDASEQESLDLRKPAAP